MRLAEKPEVELNLPQWIHAQVHDAVHVFGNLMWDLLCTKCARKLQLLSANEPSAKPLLGEESAHASRLLLAWSRCHSFGFVTHKPLILVKRQVRSASVKQQVSDPKVRDKLLETLAQGRVVYGIRRCSCLSTKVSADHPKRDDPGVYT